MSWRLSGFAINLALPASSKTERHPKGIFQMSLFQRGAVRSGSVFTGFALLPVVLRDSWPGRNDSRGARGQHRCGRSRRARYAAVVRSGSQRPRHPVDENTAVGRRSTHAHHSARKQILDPLPPTVVQFVPLDSHISTETNSIRFRKSICRYRITWGRASRPASPRYCVSLRLVRPIRSADCQSLAQTN